jgi:ribosomal protein S18 acetylase RimI-like enzyme
VIELREVVTEDDVVTWLGIRARIDPEHPITRSNFDDRRGTHGRIDLLGLLDGEAVGAAWGSPPYASETSEFQHANVRVLAEARRRGVGSALFERLSEHARSLGRTRLYLVTRSDDEEMLGYLHRRGFEELTRMEDVALDLRASSIEPETPPGVKIVPVAVEHERGMYEVSLEADADVPSPDPFVPGSFERWLGYDLGPQVIRELSFVALEDGVVIGWATLGGEHDGTAYHWMTSVARRARGRGVARGLKTHQIAAARGAGLRELRTTNDVANRPMRRVNERLGYTPRLTWIHLGGPLLDREPC